MNTPPLTPFAPRAVLGVGIDTVDVARIRAAIERNGDVFLKRVFTDAEIALCDGAANRFQRYAARWAAKEAASKALGTGIGADFDLKSLSVESDPRGAPRAVLDAKATRTVAARGGADILLSLTHTAAAATAIALLVR